MSLALSPTESPVQTMQEEWRGFLAEGEREGMRHALGLPRHAPLGLAGGTLSQRAGSSLEFKDHRGYEPGDDLRHIDWNAYARSDQLSVKLYREEVTPRVDVVIDGSRSMALEESDKLRATLALAGFFAAAADNAGFRHAAWLLGEELRAVGNGSGPPTTWEDLSFDAAGPPTPAAMRGGAGWRPGGVRILLSDLLWEGDPPQFVRPFAERAAVAVVVQVLARADVEPPEGQSLRLVDVETGLIREIHIDAVAARGYRTALARHQQHWHEACRQAGALMTTVVAEDVLRDWALEELVAAEVLRV
jgi:uncharacterized protein (DUF58 family)